MKTIDTLAVSRRVARCRTRAQQDTRGFMGSFLPSSIQGKEDRSMVENVPSFAP